MNMDSGSGWAPNRRQVIAAEPMMYYQIESALMIDHLSRQNLYRLWIIVQGTVLSIDYDLYID